MSIFSCNKCGRLADPNKLIHNGGLCQSCYNFLFSTGLHPGICHLLRLEVEAGNQINNYITIGSLGGKWISVSLKYDFSQHDLKPLGELVYSEEPSGDDITRKYTGVEYIPIDNTQKLKVMSEVYYSPSDPYYLPGEPDLAYFGKMILGIVLTIVALMAALISLFPTFFMLLGKAAAPVIFIAWLLKMRGK